MSSKQGCARWHAPGADVGVFEANALFCQAIHGHNTCLSASTFRSLGLSADRNVADVYRPNCCSQPLWLPSTFGGGVDLPRANNFGRMHNDVCGTYAELNFALTQITKQPSHCGAAMGSVRR
jgi:hypothetical protein